ncbi:MAG: PAS domain S-box protein [Caldilineaceae bacterium]
MSLSPLHILIVDDFAEDRYMVRRALLHGLERQIIFDEAETGAQTIQLCGQLNSPTTPTSPTPRVIDLVLLDLRLPDQDGVEVLETLKGDKAILPMPVLVLTGQPNDQEARAALALGAQDFIAKSEITPQTLARAALNAIDRYALLQKLHASETFSRVLLESSPDCVKLLDLDGHLLSMNEAGQRLMEIDDLSSRLGEDWLDLWPERALVQQALNLAKAGGEGHFQGFRPTAKGRPKWWDGRVIRVTTPGSAQDVLLAVSRDMTEQKRADQRLAVEHTVTQVLMEAASLDAAAPAIVSAFCQQLHIEIGEFWLLDQSQEQIICTARCIAPALAQSQAGQDFSQYNVFARNICLAGTAWQRRAPVWMQDMADDPHFWRSAALAALNLRMGFACPILNGDELIGVITLFAHQPFAPEAALLTMMAAIGRDIGQFVQRKRAEAALRQSEEAYRTLFDQAGVGKAEFTGRDWRFLRANHKLCEITGYTADELSAMTYEQLVHSDELEAFAKLRAQVADRSMALYTIEQRCRRKDGTTRWFELNLSPIRHSQQAVLRSVGTFQDITDRKRAEVVLRESELFKQAVLNSLPNLLAVLDTNGQITAVNEAWMRFAQESGADADLTRIGVGMNYLDICRQATGEYATGAQAVLEGIQAILEGRQALFMYEYPCPTPAKERWFLLSATRLQTSEGGAVVSHLEITERRELEKSLRLLETAIAQSNEAVLITDGQLDAPGPHILYANHAFTAMTGYKTEEVLGQNPRLLQGPKTERAVLTRLRQQLANGEVFQGETINYRKDGSEFHLEWRVAPIRNAEGAITNFVALQHDISERKAAAEAVRANAEHFRSLVNAIPQIVWINNSEGKREYLNERWLQYTGLSYEASLADANQAIHPDDRAQAVAVWAQAQLQGIPYEHEMRLRRADGVYRWHLMRTVPVHDADRRIVNWYGTATDIDERKRAELNQKFLTDLTNQLRMLVDPEEIRWTVISALGQYLGVDRCGLNEVDVAADRMLAQGSWRQQGLRDLDGAYPLSSFMSPELQRLIRAGQSVAVADAFTDPRLAGSTEIYQRLSMRAFALTPSLEQGRWGALLVVVCVAPRVWQADEVALLETVATRFWPLIEKARAEQALQASAAQLRLITDSIPGLISYVDTAQRYRFVNAAYESWFARSRQEIIGAHMREILGAETYQRIETYAQAALAGQQVTFQQVYPRHDGARRTAMVTYVPQFEQDSFEQAAIAPPATGEAAPPRVAGFHILLTDITELKETEAALRASEELSRRQLAELQAVYATAPIGLAVLDCDLRYVRLNERLAEINGRSIREHWGRTVREIVPALADVVEPHFQQVLATGEPLLGVEINGETAAQPGVERSWLENCYPLATADGQVIGVNVVIQDMTERKRDERELKQINETLEQRVAERTRELTQRYEELDRFAYVASHDLKAPLRAIEHLATWISEDVDELLPAKSKAHLEKMRSRIKRMEGLLDDLLAYSRADRYTSNPEQVDTGQLVEEVVKLFSLPEGFIITAQSPMPVVVTERVPLELILRNLFSNAIKHHHRRDGHVQVTAHDLGNAIEFAVSDDGPGIDPQFHERIFQMFQTLQPRDKVEGSGIGLAVVKKVLESRGGKISVESAEGRGATFRFIWPK